MSPGGPVSGGRREARGRCKNHMKVGTGVEDEERTAREEVPSKGTKR